MRPLRKAGSLVSISPRRMSPKTSAGSKSSNSRTAASVSRCSLSEEVEESRSEIIRDRFGGSITGCMLLSTLRHVSAPTTATWKSVGCRIPLLRQDSADDFRRQHLSQFLAQAVLVHKELLVVEAEQMQDRGVPVGDAHLVLRRGQADLVGAPVGRSSFYSAPRKPAAGGVLVVVASRLLFVLVGRQLGNRQAAKLSTPNHERFIEQAPLLQIRQQTRNGEISPIAGSFHIRREPGVIVPNLGVDIELHETDSPLNQAAGDQAPPAIRIRRLLADAIEFQRPRALPRQIKRFAARELHPSCQLVARDASLQIGLTGTLQLVQLIELLEQLPLHGGYRQRVGFLGT